MTMTREEYEARREARLQRWEALSRKAQDQGGHLVAIAKEMADVIPFGQPILIGHHSEGRDRAYRGRIENKFRKGFQLYQKAEYFAERAEAARNNTTIFSDDPGASEKIEAKLERLKKKQEIMKAANAYIKKSNWQGLADLGFSEAQIEDLLKPDYMGRGGYPPYALQNNGAEIRRLEQRLKVLEAHAQDTTSEFRIGPARVVDNCEENRLQIFFPGKPEDGIRKDLKSHGFRWSSTIGCWQAYRGPNANYWSRSILTKFYGDKSE